MVSGRGHFWGARGSPFAPRHSRPLQMRDTKAVLCEENELQSCTTFPASPRQSHDPAAVPTLSGRLSQSPGRGGVTMPARPNSLPQAPSVPGAGHRSRQSPVVWVMKPGCPGDCCLKLQNASRSSNYLQRRGRKAL